MKTYVRFEMAAERETIAFHSTYNIESEISIEFTLVQPTALASSYAIPVKLCHLQYLERTSHYYYSNKHDDSRL
jgi:hypothetical protein